MKGNVVVAAAVFAVAVVVASVVLVLGIRTAADRTMTRFETAVREHARAVERGGEAAGLPVRQGIEQLSATVKTHAASVERGGELVGAPVREAVKGLAETVKIHAASVEGAGEKIARPTIRMEGPIDVKQPVKIEGPREDGALPVDARIGK